MVGWASELKMKRVLQPRSVRALNDLNVIGRTTRKISFGCSYILVVVPVLHTVVGVEGKSGKEHGVSAGTLTSWKFSATSPETSRA
jgi:hypothetical protein